jgi:hypothetical protein
MSFVSNGPIPRPRNRCPLLAAQPGVKPTGGAVMTEPLTLVDNGGAAVVTDAGSV